MAKKVGIMRIRVGGALWDTKRGSTIDPGGKKREPRPGSTTTGGFTEEMVPAKIECTLLFGAGDSLTAINAIEGETITAECDTGQTYIIRDGYCAEPAQLTEGEGEAKVVFMGSAAEELL